MQLSTVQYPPDCAVSQRRSPWDEQSVDRVHLDPIAGLQPARARAASETARPIFAAARPPRSTVRRPATGPCNRVRGGPPGEAGAGSRRGESRGPALQAPSGRAPPPRRSFAQSKAQTCGLSTRPRRDLGARARRRIHITRGKLAALGARLQATGGCPARRRLWATLPASFSRGPIPGGSPSSGLPGCGPSTSRAWPGANGPSPARPSPPPGLLRAAEPRGAPRARESGPSSLAVTATAHLCGPRSRGGRPPV
jgi:hypothetical protein